MYRYTCSIKNCTARHYARGYCRNHYTKFIRCGNPLGTTHKCKVLGCIVNLWKGDYCQKHKYRIKYKLPLDLSTKYMAKGENHWCWKGGISEYPNQAVMKKQRKIKLANNPLCSCGDLATQIHHKDESKTNHSMSNLEPLCYKCHSKVHSRYYKQLGYTLTEIVQMDKFKHFSLSYWSKQPIKILRELLDKS